MGFSQVVEVTAVTTDSGNAEIYYNLANALEGSGQASLSVTEFEVTFEINPQLVEAQRNLDVLLVQNRRVDGAIIHFQKAVEIQADDTLTHNSLASAPTRFHNGAGR